MTLPTHAIFYILVSNLLGLPLQIQSIIVGIIGTVLPDISNTYGFGRIIKPVSSYIAQKWGHRTITHSWVIVILSFGSRVHFLKNSQRLPVAFDIVQRHSQLVGDQDISPCWRDEMKKPEKTLKA